MERAVQPWSIHLCIYTRIYERERRRRRRKNERQLGGFSCSLVVSIRNAIILESPRRVRNFPTVGKEKDFSAGRNSFDKDDNGEQDVSLDFSQDWFLAIEFVLSRVPLGCANLVTDSVKLD